MRVAQPSGYIQKGCLDQAVLRETTGIKTCILKYLVIQNKDEIMICNNFC